MRPLSVAVLICVVAFVSASAPLWVYALSLSLFGLPHVLVELRYVDQRFSGCLPRNTVLWLGAGLLGIAGLRALSFSGVDVGLSKMSLVEGELLLGIGLVFAALPLLVMPGRSRASLLAFLVVSALIVGIVYAPLVTLVSLAFLHNLTPVGFLAERLEGQRRRRVLQSSAVVFALVPLLLMFWPYVPAHLGGPFAVGELSQHLGAFVPSPWAQSAFGERLFAAGAFLQVMHYAVVLGVLPRLGAGRETSSSTLPWPRASVFLALVLALGGIATASFLVDFGQARSGYAIFAAVHAWIEIPTLLVACSFCSAPRHSLEVA